LATELVGLAWHPGGAVSLFHDGRHVTTPNVVIPFLDCTDEQAASAGSRGKGLVATKGRHAGQCLLLQLLENLM